MRTNKETLLYLAYNVKYLREQKKWTQQDLAVSLNVKRSLVGAWEEGRSKPDIQHAIKIAVYLGVRVNDIYNTHVNKIQRPKPEKGYTISNITTVLHEVLGDGEATKEILRKLEMLL